jgi:cysteine desulfurase
MNFSTLRAKGPGQASIYLDHNATSPLASDIAERVPRWLEQWGNPSSIHQFGRGPKTILRESRDNIARMIGAQPLELIFTASGSEANNFALKGIFHSFAKLALAKPGFQQNSPRVRYVLSQVEHPSIMKAAEYLRECGADVSFIPVSRSGAIDLESYRHMVDEKTALVSVMFANNETGNLFPISTLAKIAHEKGALFHCDCVQALGKVPIDVRELGVDLATFSGHKFYALKGVGVLYAKRGVTIESLIHGGGQERHRRGGTENVLAIGSLGAMAERRSEVVARGQHMQRQRDHLERRILAEISSVTITGTENPRLPNSSSLVIAGVDGETLLMNLDMRGFAVSTGAACSSGSPEPSPVLLGMGLSRVEAQSSLRLSLGWGTADSEIDQFVDTLKTVVAHLRSFAQVEREFHVNV